MAELVDAEIDAVKETILNQPLVDAVSVISWNAHDVEIVSEYHTTTGSNPVLTTYSASVVGN